MTQYAYDDAGRLTSTIHLLGSPFQREDRVVYENGRVKRRIQNYQDGNFSVASPEQDISVIYGYDGLGRTVLVTQTGILTGSFTLGSRQFTQHTVRVTRTDYDDLDRPISEELVREPLQYL